MLQGKYRVGMFEIRTPTFRCEGRRQQEAGERCMTRRFTIYTRYH